MRVISYTQTAPQVLQDRSRKQAPLSACSLRIVKHASCKLASTNKLIAHPSTAGVATLSTPEHLIEWLRKQDPVLGPQNVTVDSSTCDMGRSLRALSDTAADSPLLSVPLPIVFRDLEVSHLILCTHIAVVLVVCLCTRACHAAEGRGHISSLECSNGNAPAAAEDALSGWCR